MVIFSADSRDVRILFCLLFFLLILLYVCIIIIIIIYTPYVYIYIYILHFIPLLSYRLIILSLLYLLHPQRVAPRLPLVVPISLVPLPIIFTLMI
jgi:hypothetical protein